MTLVSPVPLVLSAEQLDQFHESGYHIARGLLTGAEVDHIRATFMAQAVDGPVPDLSETGRTFHPDDPLARYPRMMNPHHHADKAVGPLARRYLLDGRVQAILQDLFGEPPLAVQSMFYFKPPGARGQDLHQDNFYLRVRPGTCMAAWMAIDNADPGNGGMVVVPGSQRLDLLCPELADPVHSFTTEHVSPPPGMHPQAVALRAGDVLFFNGSLIHGSYPNTSTDRFRRALICHYAPRSSTEVSRWYRRPLTFDGQEIIIPDATGGGPCGTLQEPSTPH